MKGKEEKESFAYLNAEFQRIARRVKKAFLSEKSQKKKKKGRQLPEKD